MTMTFGSDRAKVSLSLRTRVALVSGVVAALVAVVLGVAYFALLATTSSRQLDQTVSTMAVRVARPADVALAQPLPGSHLHITSTGPGPGPVAALPSLPALPIPGLPLPDIPPHVVQIADNAIAPVAGAPGMAVVLRPDRDAVDSAIHRSQLIGLAVAVGGVLLATALGWFLAGYAARPLRKLATATHGIDTLEKLPPLSGRGVREAEDLSDAITRMLSRLETAHGETSRALAGARDFAAVCAHELRTPLTAMRTDLEVLATKDLPAEQQRAVLDDVLLAERQIENTLTDLEQLAVGELTESDTFEPFELCETLDRAVQDARRRHPEVRIDLTECTPTTVTGLPGGLKLIVTNAVANAVQHGHANTVTVAARRYLPSSDDPSTAAASRTDPHTETPDAADQKTLGLDTPNSNTTVEIVIDDDGTGIPAPLRPQAFDRFVKGPGSPGSGLGLALVRQQAEIHSGTAELDQSALGGVCLRVRIPARNPS